jgi:hypothetical protein
VALALGVTQIALYTCIFLRLLGFNGISPIMNDCGSPHERRTCEDIIAANIVGGAEANCSESNPFGACKSTAETAKATRRNLSGMLMAVNLDHVQQTPSFMAKPRKSDDDKGLTGIEVNGTRSLSHESAYILFCNLLAA